MPTFERATMPGRNGRSPECPKCGTPGLAKDHDYETNASTPHCLACGWRSRENAGRAAADRPTAEDKPGAAPVRDAVLEGFEEFAVGRGRRNSNTLGGYLAKSGVLRLTERTVQALGDPEAVRVLFHRGRRCIAIHGCPADTHGAARCTRADKSAARKVALAQFCDHFGIPHDEAALLPGKMAGDILLLDAPTQTAKTKP